MPLTSQISNATNAAIGVPVHGDRQRLGGSFNFLLGSDPDRWRTRVPGYARVRYCAIHPGVDLLVHEGEKSLQYDLELAVGADLDGFVVRCEGVDSLAIDEDFAPARVSLAYLYAKEDGNLERARALVWRAVQSRPASPQLWLRLARV